MLSEKGVGFALFCSQIVLPFGGAFRVNKTLSTSTRSHESKVKNLKTIIARLLWFSRLANGFTRTKHDHQLLRLYTVDVTGFPTSLDSFHDICLVSKFSFCYN